MITEVLWRMHSKNWSQIQYIFGTKKGNMGKYQRENVLFVSKKQNVSPNSNCDEFAVSYPKILTS